MAECPPLFEPMQSEWKEKQSPWDRQYYNNNVSHIILSVFSLFFFFLLIRILCTFILEKFHVLSQFIFCDFAVKMQYWSHNLLWNRANSMTSAKPQKNLDWNRKKKKKIEKNGEKSVLNEYAQKRLWRVSFRMKLSWISRKSEPTERTALKRAKIIIIIETYLRRSLVEWRVTHFQRHPSPSSRSASPFPLLDFNTEYKRNYWVIIMPLSLATTVRIIKLKHFFRQEINWMEVECMLVASVVWKQLCCREKMVISHS